MFLARQIVPRMSTVAFLNSGRTFSQKASTLVIKKAEGIGYGERDIKVLHDHEENVEKERLERERRAALPKLEPLVYGANLDTVGDIVFRYLLTHWGTPEHIEHVTKKGHEVPAEIPENISRKPYLWPPIHLARGLIVYRGTYTKWKDPSYWCITHIIPKKTGHLIYYGVETFRGKVLVPKIQRMTSYRKTDWYVFPPGQKPETANWHSIVLDRDNIFRYPPTPYAQVRMSRLREKRLAKK